MRFNKLQDEIDWQISICNRNNDENNNVERSPICIYSDVIWKIRLDVSRLWYLSRFSNVQFLISKNIAMIFCVIITHVLSVIKY